MKKADKDLLLKDLCARFPYGVICEIRDGEGKIIEKLGLGGLGAFINGTMSVKPCLRPMSSITEEEKENLQLLHNIISDENYGDGYSPSAWDAIVEWEGYCNSKHLDFRGLIPKGLAIAVTEENNPYKE